MDAALKSLRRLHLYFVKESILCFFSISGFSHAFFESRFGYESLACKNRDPKTKSEIGRLTLLRLIL